MSQEIAEAVEVIRPILRKAARDGLVYTYDQLLAEPPVKGLIGGDRNRLYEALDEINAETCVDGYLLSAVVIGEHGMPGTGFFRKLRRGDWSPRSASRSVARQPGHAVFRGELRRVFDKFRAPRRAAVFIDLENVSAVQNQAVDAIDALRGKFSDVRVIGFYRPSEHSPSGVSSWKEANLKRIRRMCHGKAHKDVAFKTSAADSVLIGEWKTWVLEGHQSRFFPRVILTPRDVVCLFSDDPIYHNSILEAMDLGFDVWGFGHRTGEEGPELSQYRKTLNERGRCYNLHIRKEWDFSVSSCN